MTAAATLALLALAQAAAGAPPPAQDVPTVTVTGRPPVVVTASQPCPEPKPARYPASEDPRVVDSFPRDGASVSPGLVRVRVTFDAPMSCYAEVTQEGGDRDPCEPRGSWTLPDRRSFVLQCRLQAGKAYTFSFRRDSGRGFVGLSGRDAAPFVLRFATTDEPPVQTWSQALAADPGPPGAGQLRGYVTCAAVEGEGSDDCSRQRFGTPAPPP